MKNFIEYLNQINLEIKKTLGSKLMLIFIGLLLVASIAVPIISTLDLFESNYYYSYGEGDLIVEGITIDEDSYLYWDVFQLSEAKSRLEDEAVSSNDDLAIELVDAMLNDYLAIANDISDYDDYRTDIIWSRSQHYISRFILENIDIPSDEMQEIIEKTDYYYMDVTELQDEYYDLTEEERQEKINEVNEALELSDKIVLHGDKQAYFDYMINEAEASIKSYQKDIEELEQSIIETPSNEDLFNEQIESLYESIETYETIRIPILQYRQENDIIPGSDDWRDTALDEKRSALYQLHYNSEPMTQEEFEEEQYAKWEYGTYANYLEVFEANIEEATNELLIAEKSLETNEPDMKYVLDGTRQKVTNFLWYSLIIAVFAAIFAGGLMAREFQLGTIRLLLIRPKSRAKIALSKFFALILICIAVYVSCVILNLVTNGFVFGFKDLGYPNYTISAGAKGISFFAYIIPKLFASFVVVIFGASVAYFLSIVTRNTALSVSIPLVAFAGSLIAMQIIGYSDKYKWIIYTPLPYVNMPQILTENYYSPAGIEPIISYGIGLLIGLSVIAVVLGTIILKRRDITN